MRYSLHVYAGSSGKGGNTPHIEQGTNSLSPNPKRYFVEFHANVLVSGAASGAAKTHCVATDIGKADHARLAMVNNRMVGEYRSLLMVDEYRSRGSRKLKMERGERDKLSLRSRRGIGEARRPSVMSR